MSARYSVWSGGAWSAGFFTLKLAREFARGEKRRKPQERVELRDDGRPIEVWP